MTSTFATPTISVIMPAHNQAAYIGQAVASVQAQTVPAWELIVIDDGSTDDTRAVVTAIQDARVRCVPQANLERSRARNAGLALARGRYVAFLDADDFWLPGFMARSLAALEADREASFSVCGIFDTAPNGQVVRSRLCGPYVGQSPTSFFEDMLLGNRIPICTALVRADRLQQAGFFDETLRQNEDWDLWLRLLALGHAAPIPTPLACYRRYNVLMPPRQRGRGAETALVHILEKCFAALGPSPLQALRPRALAQVYWRTAWMHAALGETEPAHTALHQARDLDPAFFGPPWRAWAEAAAYMADELYDLSTPADEGLAAIEMLLNQLPAWAVGLQTQRRRIRGQFWGLQFYRSYEQRQGRALLRAAAMAAVTEPRWLLNRGFVVITLRMLGRSVFKRPLRPVLPAPQVTP